MFSTKIPGRPMRAERRGRDEGLRPAPIAEVLVLPYPRDGEAHFRINVEILTITSTSAKARLPTASLAKNSAFLARSLTPPNFAGNAAVSLIGTVQPLKIVAPKQSRHSRNRSLGL